MAPRARGLAWLRGCRRLAAAIRSAALADDTASGRGSEAAPALGACLRLRAPLALLPGNRHQHEHG
eukprot:13006496-Alexandrium_andersonii.AAC.1